MICIFLFGTCSIKAQSWLQTADSLFTTGQYFEAGLAYERVLFDEQDPLVLYVASLGKARCLNQRGLYAKASNFLNNQIQLTTNDTLLYQLRYQQILSTYLTGQFENTLSLADRLAYLHPNQPVLPMVTVIRILALNELQRWPEAASLYTQLVHNFGSDTTTSPYAHLPQLKSVKKAQWLATVIPGAGQFYAGKPAEAVFSILVQSLGLYIGITNFIQGYYLSAWGIGAALFGSFHAGSVRRSEVLINQYNQKRINAFNQLVKEQVLRLASGH